MGLGLAVAPAIFHLLNLCLIVFVFKVQRSAGSNISPSPAIFPAIPPIEGKPAPLHQINTSISNAPISESQPNGSTLHPPPALPPLTSAPLPQTIPGVVPSSSPRTPIVNPPDDTAPPPLGFPGNAPSLLPTIPIVSPPKSVAPPPLIAQELVPSMPPNASQGKAPVKIPVAVPSAPAASPPLKFEGNQPTVPQIAPPIMSSAPASVASPTGKLPSNSEEVPGASPSILPGPNISHASTPTPSVDWKKGYIPVSSPPAETPKSSPPLNNSTVKAASPPKNLEGKKPTVHPIAPAFISSAPASAVSPTGESSSNSPVVPGESPSMLPGPNISHASTPSPSVNWKEGEIPVAPPLAETPKFSPPFNNSPAQVPAVAPSTHKNTRHFNNATLPSLPSPESPPNGGYLSPASSPSSPFGKQNQERNETHGPAPLSSRAISLPPIKQKAIPPSFLPGSRRTHHASPPLSLGLVPSGSHKPISRPKINVSPAPSPSSTATSSWTRMPVISPKVSPSGSSSTSPKLPPLLPVQALPPPPPNEDCSAIACTEPYTNTPPGAPCGCVLPMQVGLSLSVALYTFFPLVSELAQETAAGVFMKQSQVRIMGANAASQEPEKTIVLIDLVPLGERFDNTTAFLTYQRFWHKQVVIKYSLFGDYEVLYVRYPGLPPSPPSAPSGINIIDDGPYSGNSNNGRAIKPLGVDVPKKHHKVRLSAAVIAIIALSASVALILCSVVVWALLFRHRNHVSQPTQTPGPLPPSIAKPSGATASRVGSGLSSASLSFGSSIATYTGSAKTFSTSDIERATNKFDDSRILGEGGFGRVYSGILEDGTKVAVKVLKRDDQQGGREFLAEVEMLSRLHHRNLVKLIGICTEERTRCLVYELIPNGSVESHLHGVDKESAPLDWDARIKIALGAARGLAYLHEDSSPRVIHRDFKSSNILLEHDFTPKVSDFGLARTAMEEENRHISTRVMGTFGYVAPEYAMTGHLLVKSDVYSYGVVILELLTGRKPVDMSQPPGEENLVAWARPLLTSKEGLEMIIDPSLGPDVSFDSVSKVAAIASMCVQPEVSHRPFMGEVVQALKLVCNECDEAKEVGSRSSSRDLSVDMDAGVSADSGHLLDPFHNQPFMPNYDSEPDIERGLPMSELFSTSARYGRQASGSFRRYSSSGPLPTGRGRRLWQRARRMTGEGSSERMILFRLWPGSH